MSRLKNVDAWIYGLIGGFIGGGAATVTSATGLWAARAMGLDVPILNLKAAGVVFLSSGIYNALMYLKKSPLPELEVSAPAAQPAPETKK